MRNLLQRPVDTDMENSPIRNARFPRRAIPALLLVILPVQYVLSQEELSQTTQPVDSLTLLLSSLRNNSQALLPEIHKERRRLLSERILSIDSTNALANLELGEMEVQSFERYRNAVTLSPEMFVDVRGGSESSLRKGDGSTSALQTSLSSLLMKSNFDLDRAVSRGSNLSLSTRSSEAFARAERYLLVALNADPQLQPVYVALTRLYVSGERTDNLSSLVRKMREYLPEDEKTWLYSGYSAYHDGNLQDADQYYARALELLSSEESDEFRSIEEVIADDEMPRYEANRALYRSGYWSGHDVRFLTSENERLLEQYTRVVYSDLFFSAPRIHKRGWDTDRGRVYVRYGVPAREIAISNYIIWEYGNEERLVFYDPFPLNEYNLFSPKATELALPGQNAWATDYVIRARELFRLIPVRSTFRPKAHRIRVPYQVSVFKSETQTADVYVAIGFPVPIKPEGSSLGIGLKVGAFLSIPDYGIISQNIKSKTDLNTEQIHELSDGAVWADVSRLGAPPGIYEVSAELETKGGSIVGYERAELVVTDYQEKKLSMSDLMLALRVEKADPNAIAGGGQIIRRDLSITAAPTAVFQIGRPIYMYFEVYGLNVRDNGERAYTVEAALVREDESKGVRRLVDWALRRPPRGGVSVRFTVNGASTDDAQYMILDTDNQEPGKYVVAVQVTDRGTGESVEARRTLELE